MKSKTSLESKSFPDGIIPVKGTACAKAWKSRPAGEAIMADGVRTKAEAAFCRVRLQTW